MPERKIDDQWMQLAIDEARKGIGLTSPNPPVGAVIVKGDTLLGKGWHTRAGRPHAEREAIANALSQHPVDEIHGATIYVTLEPCSSHGRTPPCTQGILDAGIKRVVYGAEDPNPDHSGRAKQLLEREGVRVTSGICETDCQSLIRPFSKRQRTGLPWVLIKSAISLDGRITRPPGEGQWLSSPESRAVVQKLRHQSDAIITGGNTLRRDNPALTVRTNSLPLKEQPWRMVITRGSSSSLPNNLQLFTDAHAHRTLVQEQGDLRAALLTLVDKGCNSVLVEAGGTLMAAFLSAGLVDEVAIFYAPMITGGPDSGFAGIPCGTKLRNQTFTRIGDDILLNAFVC
ncbi:MAG: bifunctional diaminohydroxyphosphoribosylaminopyrimidine deaminase/5-amino-6-(5-phosphoribosylamino)uracil reductase RibD [Akkermansiaceae bacterium]|nr:bifunctional diaminohydroxyphosphoribosylaminopyrimidine deaminase/5-amino-6-(5-phosphoribosylamino)uracil reductase RibD [Akkermansiaceae bacterium]